MVLELVDEKFLSLAVLVEKMGRKITNNGHTDEINLTRRIVAQNRLNIRESRGQDLNHLDLTRRPRSSSKTPGAKVPAPQNRQSLSL